MLFRSQYVSIDPNANILSLGPYFTRSDNNVFRDGRFYVPSQAIADKLRQHLIIEMKRRPAYILNFYTRTVLENYYQHVTDFRRNYNFIITKSRETPTVIPIVPPQQLMTDPELPVATVALLPDGEQIFVATR